MKYILGISFGFNASACIMDEDHNVVYAASEERFTNIKNCKQFPLSAIKHGLELLAINPRDVVICRYSHYQKADIYDMYRHTYGIDKKIPHRITTPQMFGSIINQEINDQMEKEFIRHHLSMLGIHVGVMERINHHYAHAKCSYVLHPFHDSKYTNLYVVMDGFGDGESITAWVQENSKLRKVYSAPMCKSVALVYQFVTGALGYKEHQHEGKLTGLASYGDSLKYYDDFSELYDNFEAIPHTSVASPIIDFDIFTEMRTRTYNLVNDILKDIPDEDKFEESKHIAASLQAFSEDTAGAIIDTIIAQENLTNVNLILSGGLFANVKINQRMHELTPQVHNIFIAPPMGDEGTCIGAASGYDEYSLKGNTITNMTMRKGTSHDDCDIENCIPDDLSYVHFDDKLLLARCIAADLADNEIVCLFDGRMEFGPRALIGRSIMYNCRDVGANDWLNKQLGRTEFMPFAPFCKEEHMRDLFYKVKGKEYALKNMTITVDCKDEFIDNYPAACHIDNTARPQVISKEENELAWMILDQYEGFTGEKALINTSFNLHNYPIIESPQVAIESWKKSNTHVLYIGNESGWFRIVRK